MRHHILIGVVAMMSLGMVAAGQQRPGVPTSPPPLVPPPVTPPPGRADPTPPPLSERPERLMQIQRFVWDAYPELTTTGAQMRVDDSGTDVSVTFGEAVKDRDDLLGLSRPRTALLVGTFTFDAAEALQKATLEGALTHVAERRRIQALPSGWTAALEAEQARYAPTKQLELLQRAQVAKPRAALVGTLQLEGAQFKMGTADEPLYWEVTARGPAGEAIQLGYEPYRGQLIRFERIKGGR